jgi:hypothetical protein
MFAQLSINFPKMHPHASSLALKGGGAALAFCGIFAMGNSTDIIIYITTGYSNKARFIGF